MRRRVFKIATILSLILGVTSVAGRWVQLEIPWGNSTIGLARGICYERPNRLPELDFDRPLPEIELFHATIGLACLSLVLMLGHALAQRFEKVQRRENTLCPACGGYDLTGNVSGVCPECGTPIPSQTEGVA